MLSLAVPSPQIKCHATDKSYWQNNADFCGVRISTWSVCLRHRQLVRRLEFFFSFSSVTTFGDKLC